MLTIELSLTKATYLPMVQIPRGSVAPMLITGYYSCRIVYNEKSVQARVKCSFWTVRTLVVEMVYTICVQKHAIGIVLC